MTLRDYLFLLLSLLLLTHNAAAHHVLGRPTYSLNENGSTPPSVQIETQIGKYFVNIMAYPAFPKANEPGRIKLYASHINGAGSLTVPVTFKVRDNNWLDTNQETLGAQIPIENIYNQAFIFTKDGDYIITADFFTDGEPYQIDFPITIGNPTPIFTIGFFASFIFVALITVNIIQRRRLQRLQTQRHHDDARPE